MLDKGRIVLELAPDEVCTRQSEGDFADCRMDLYCLHILALLNRAMTTRRRI